MTNYLGPYLHIGDRSDLYAMKNLLFFSRPLIRVKSESIPVFRKLFMEGLNYICKRRVNYHTAFVEHLMALCPQDRL